MARLISKTWVLAYSGGKDSTVLLDLAFRYWLDHRDIRLIVTHNEVLLDPPPLYNWVYRVLPAVAEAGVEVVAILPKLDYITAMLERGYSAPGHYFMWCTTEMKRKPTERFMRQFGERWVKLTGVRADESARRATYCKLGECGFVGKKWASYDVAPLASWTVEDVIEYLRTHRQPWSGEDYSYLLDVVYCGKGELRNGCWICTLVKDDDMLRTYAECFNDPRYLKVLELKRQLRRISLDWDMRQYKSKKFNEKGIEVARRILVEMFSTMPELLRPWLTFKPHVIEQHLPELTPLMKRQEPLYIRGVKIVEY